MEDNAVAGGGGGAEDAVDIDDALYSRQRYVLGDGAMQRMARSHVFIGGMGGLGIEVGELPPTLPHLGGTFPLHSTAAADAACIFTPNFRPFY